MNALLSALLHTAILTTTSSQIGGGSSTYGQGRQSALEAARATELAKRNAYHDDTGRYVDAAVLMNAEADDYVATFGLNEEGKTLTEARQKMDGTIRGFGDGLRQLKLTPAEWSTDFIAQNRIYGYELNGNISKEVVVGFEVKKNLSVRYKDKAMLERLMEAASKVGVFDLVKVEYIVKDPTAIRAKLIAEAAKVLRQKRELEEQILGVKLGQPIQGFPPQFSTYFPTEMYDAYTAQESEGISDYRPNTVVQRARKSTTFFFNGLTGKDFDAVINPVNTEPSVQFTVYVRVRY